MYSKDERVETRPLSAMPRFFLVCVLPPQWKLDKCPFMYSQIAFFQVIVTMLSFLEHPASLFSPKETILVRSTHIDKSSIWRVFAKLQGFTFLPVRKGFNKREASAETKYYFYDIYIFNAAAFEEKVVILLSP